MTNPFDDIDFAFAPMFDDTIVLRDNKGIINQSINCVIFQDVNDDVSDGFLDNETESITIYCQKSDFDTMKKLRRGDIIIRPDSDKKYTICSITEDKVFGVIIKAKSV